MGRLWTEEHEKLAQALRLLREAARLIDGDAPTAEAHLGSARIMLQAMISTPAAVADKQAKVERPRGHRY